MKSLKKTIYHSIFVVVLLISGFIRFSQSANFDFPFTYDQARDMLDIRVLGGFYDYKISGPTTSITGLNLGPFYYVFNLPAYWLGGGNPQYLVYWNILWFLFSGIVLYVFFYKRDKLLAIFLSTIYLMSPQLFSVTRYFWNANSVVYFIVFYFIAFWKFVEGATRRNTIIWGIASGLVIQFEAAFGSMCVVFSFLAVLVSKKKTNLKYYVLGLVPWFFPQAVYEVIHNFQMTRLLFGVVQGQNTLLGDKLPLSQTLRLHLISFTNFFEGQFIIGYGVGLLLLVFSLIFALKSAKYRLITKYLVAFILFAYIYYALIYPHGLKPWYLEGIRVWFIFIVSISFSILSKANKQPRTKNIQSFPQSAKALPAGKAGLHQLSLTSLINSGLSRGLNKIFLPAICVFLTVSFYRTIIDQSSYVLDNGKSDDPKNAQNIMRSIDWVYIKAKGEGFTAYNYVPEVHDFSINYMYWWYGKTKYSFTPEKVSYSLKLVPEYIRMEERFQNFVKENATGHIALIYETIGDYNSWLSQFDDFCIVDKKEFEWRVIAEWRAKCSK